ncbi:MAG: hypothetical protein ACSLEX_02460 [Minisyncoccota bacterium]
MFNRNIKQEFFNNSFKGGFQMKPLFSILFLCLFSALTWAGQFHPDNVHASVGGGSSSMVEIVPGTPGQFALILKEIKVVYLNETPPKGVVGLNTADDSGKGVVHVVAVASNYQLYKKTQLCWRGVGSDWETRACAPIEPDGSATVEISTGATTKNAVFALVPVLVLGDKQVGWVAHPENARVQLSCPQMPHQDTASIFVTDGRIANADEVTKYAEYYKKFCYRK